ncbi:putative sterigmatocystin biosynthesis monooxygenase stcW [Lasiodiplodia theobromae]|uniref:Putative sterigmatocystin biosynthesis monooxygenase stcW n=1 Tax=Lasiodiplodia theobromae TaxID=45133 RepID=A0A5N5DPW7_9PEZI|nr:putative sterigmatocystin biosynthesis monooxygenase stcW [Lasiodiplodia theobromae]
MAPDLNGISRNFIKNGRWDYSTPGSAGYHIPDMLLDDPATRKVKVLTIGAGFSGIMLAYQIQKSCENVEFKIYEKNEDMGGTWLENRYPGCACDIPSHAYTYNFALNPDWPRYHSYAPDIWKYLDKVCEVFDLRKYMTFNTEVIEARWNDDAGKWHVRLRQTDGAGNAREFEEECDVLLYATGILNNFKWPDLPGLKDRFKGRVVHTARWPKDYQQRQWAGERVAVIGSGASSIQTVPHMQPHVQHLDVFVRTGVWFVQMTENAEQIVEYPDEMKDAFRRDPRKMVAHAKSIEDQVNDIFEVMYAGSAKQKEAQDTMRARMQKWIRDPRLVEGFTPRFEIGCRRVTPGDPYMEAVTKDNVDVHFTAVERLTEDGVVGADGVERKCDTVVCATGFDVTYRPRFPVVGKNGVNLAEKWKDAPESYLGITVPDMPNFFMYIGPTWPVENGSVAGPLGEVVKYTIKCIKKMQKEHIKSFVPKQDVTDLFNEHTQEWYKHTVWKDSCRSWYKNNDTGRINAVWPGSSLHYMQTIQEPRYEDYEIQYQNGRNMWAFLGMGLTRESKTPGADLSPYLNVKEIDPKWLEAIGADSDAPRKASIEELSKSTLIQGLLVLNYPDYEFQRWHGTLLHIAIVVVSFLVNTVTKPLLPAIELFFFGLHVTGFLALMVPLVVMAPKASADEVFATFYNGGGWSTDGLSFFIGLSATMFAFIGCDAASHLAEEIQHASTTIPRSMFASITLNGILGLCTVIAIAFCLGSDPSSILSTPTGYPLIQMFANATSPGNENFRAATAMCSIIILACIAATINVLTSASRMLWAFARERGLPFSSWLSRVHNGPWATTTNENSSSSTNKHSNTVPFNAVLTSSIIASLLSLINIGSAVAFNAFTSLVVVASFATFILSASTLLLKRIRHRRRHSTENDDSNDIPLGAFNLGSNATGIPIIVASIAYSLLGAFFSLWPPAPDPKPEELNWSGVVFGGGVVWSLLYWAVWGRKVYTGPVLEINPQR